MIRVRHSLGTIRGELGHSHELTEIVQAKIPNLRAQLHISLPVFKSFGHASETAPNDFIHVAGDGLVAPSGYNDLTTATNGDDIIDVSGGGTDQVYAGGGNDDITASAGDVIDGGAGTNRLTLDLSSLSSGQILTFDSQSTDAVTLSDGTSFKNIQKFMLTTGDGNDTVTFDSPITFADSNSYAIFDTPDSWDAGGGTNRAIVDLSILDNFVSDQYVSSDGIDIWNIVLGDGGPGYLSLSHVQSIDLTTGSGNDVLMGGPGSDRIDGRDGNDRIDGGSGGPDTLIGGAGDDYFSHAAPGSSIDGGSGTNAFADDLSAYSADYTLVFNPGDTYTLPDGTTITGIDILVLTTGAGDDTITFNDNNNYSSLSWLPPSSWDGGGGNDTVNLDYSTGTGGISMYQPSADTVQVHSTSFGLIAGFTNVENFNVTGSAFDDYLTGSSGHNEIDGGGGFNTLVLSGNRSDYLVDYDKSIDAFTVTDLRSGTPNGTTIGTHIGQMLFADGSEIFDTAGTAPWATQFVTLDNLADISSVVITTDSGSTWINSFGTDSSYTWQTRTASYDAQGRQLTLESNNVDGTHSLTLYDATNQYLWTEATISYDANWNVTGVTGTNDDDSHTVTMQNIEAALDTALWYTGPYDANQGLPVAVTLRGGGDYNYLYGGAGDDSLTANGQFSLLDGGRGNDFLSGTFQTQFVFHDGDGLDTIDWFTGSAFGCFVELDGYGISSFSELQPYMSQVGGNVVIAFDPNNQITLGNTTLADLHAGDFLFG